MVLESGVEGVGGEALGEGHAFEGSDAAAEGAGVGGWGDGVPCYLFITKKNQLVYIINFEMNFNSK